MLWGAHHSLGSSLPRSNSPSLQPSYHVQRRKLRLRERRLVPTVIKPLAKVASAKSQTPGSVVQPTLCSRFPGLGSSFFFLFHIPSPSPFSVLHRAGSGQLVNPQAGWLSHAAPGAAPSPPPGTCTTPQAFAKEPACQCRRHRRCTFDPWVRKSPWSRKWQPTPVFLPGESPWTEEPGGLQSTGLQRAGHD